MCLECEKSISVKCIRTVIVEGEKLKAFTKDKVYGAFSWYCGNEDCYNLSAIDNNLVEHLISNGVKDDMTEFLKDEWFTKHFEVITV